MPKKPPVPPTEAAHPSPGPTPDGAAWPHYENYLPDAGGVETYYVSAAAVLPLARQQLDTFFRSVHNANEKLAPLRTRLPEGFPRWWVRTWADRFRCRTAPHARTIVDIRARHEFFRRADGVLGYSRATTHPDTPLSRDTEFTFYDKPLTVADGNGGSYPLPFAGFGEAAERDAASRLGLRPHPLPAPTQFPRFRYAWPARDPRLACEDFMVWSGFLATPEPLTPEQQEELGHVGASESGIGGEPGWCRSTYGREYGWVATVLTDSFRESIRLVAEGSALPIPAIPDAALAVVLDAVHNWLVLPPVVAARAAELKVELVLRHSCAVG